MSFKCIVPNCNTRDPHNGRGLCRKHYNLAYYRGWLSGMYMADTVAQIVASGIGVAPISNDEPREAGAEVTRLRDLLQCANDELAAVTRLLDALGAPLVTTTGTAREATPAERLRLYLDQRAEQIRAAAEDDAAEWASDVYTQRGLVLALAELGHALARGAR